MKGFAGDRTREAQGPGGPGSSAKRVEQADETARQQVERTEHEYRRSSAAAKRC